MIQCKKCKKIFKLQKGLDYHHNKTNNCLNKCNICLKKFTTKYGLSKHESIVCKQKYECILCDKVYSTKYNLSVHICDKNNHICDNNDQNIGEILKNLPNDKQIVIIQNIQNINNEIENKININNEIDNKKINIDNKKININNNFFDTQPKRFLFDYVVKEDDKRGLLEIDGYSEEIADMYMYEEEKFKKQSKDIIYKYDKDKLQVEGMKILFTRLQKDPTNRNVMIRKSKSGKCYIYDTEWIEKKLQEIITKICKRLCDTLYDQETSLNHFIRLVFGSQPNRYIELRKHIEEEIINVKQNLIN